MRRAKSIHCDLGDEKTEMELEITSLHNAPIDEVTYLVSRDDWNDAIVIDPCGYERIAETLKSQGKTCAYILLTHEHYDHIGAVNDLRHATGGQIIASVSCAQAARDPHANLSAFYDALIELHGAADWSNITPRYKMVPADFTFNESYHFSFHDLDVCFVETPGHSPGSCCIEMENLVFTGDTLLRDVPVLTRCPHGSKKIYKEFALPYLKSIDKQKLIYPGHGRPFLMRDSKYIH